MYPSTTLLNPLHRAGMFEPDLRKLLLVACASRVYHAVQLQYLEFAISAHPPSGDPIPLSEVSHKFAVFHVKELSYRNATNFEFLSV